MNDPYDVTRWPLWKVLLFVVALVTGVWVICRFPWIIR